MTADVSAFNGLTSSLSDVSITQRKSHETILVGYFWKVKKSSKIYFSEVSETSRIWFSWNELNTSQKMQVFWDAFETSYRRQKKVITFEMYLRGLWDVFFNRDLIEISLTDFMLAGSMTYMKKFPWNEIRIREIGG